MLEIKDLWVKIEGREILQGVNLNILPGEIHALMGENGSGKSTLAHTVMGNPRYKVSRGEIIFNEQCLVKLEPEERAKKGLFLSFQNPSEISGVKVFSFLRTIYNHSRKEKISPKEFRKTLEEKNKLLKLKEEFLDRYLNEGFSGGERKKMEILQMLVLEPKMVILDEVDSGLDIDALRDVSQAINYLHKKGTSFLIITHYARILKYVIPDFVHVLKNGVIVESGTKEFSEKIEAKGYRSYEKK